MAKDDGFTLLEVIVALAVITMTLTSVMQIVSGGLRNAVTAEDYMTALSQAESEIARIGADIPIRSGVRSGRFENGNRWERRISAGKTYGAVTEYTAQVTVTFEDGARDVTLSTLALKSRL